MFTVSHAKVSHKPQQAISQVQHFWQSTYRKTRIRIKYIVKN